MGGTHRDKRAGLGWHAVAHDVGGRRCQGNEANAATVALRPETVLAELRKNRVTDVVWLPDSETNWLFLLDAGRAGLRLVGVSREGMLCSIASGLNAGGRRPMILIQNTGMMESGDNSIRGWLLGMHVPVVMMVGYRGWTRHGVNTDSAATYTERFFYAFDLPFYSGGERISTPGGSRSRSPRRSAGRPAGGAGG